MRPESFEAHLHASEKDGRASYKVDGKFGLSLAENADDEILGHCTFSLVHRGISVYYAQNWICLSGKFAWEVVTDQDDFPWVGSPSPQTL